MSPNVPKLRTLVHLAGLALALSACGGAARDASVADLVDHAPTSASMDLEVGGVTSASSTLPFAAVASPGLSLAMEAATSVTGEACHPHLFARTAEVVWRLNAVFRRHLRHVDALIARNPTLVAGDSATWTRTGDGEPQRQLTITRSTDGLTYEFTLAVAPAGQTPPIWVTIMTGHVTDASTATVKERTGALSFDYDALHSVVPLERITGVVDVSFDRLHDASKPGAGVKRTTEVFFHGFSFGPNDPHGPRDGSFTHVGEPGTGGSVSYTDDLVLLCPANPSALEASTVTQSRWFMAADGVHGRSDAKATGGQIAAGDTWMGVSCHQAAASADPATSTDSAYWMMKLEDGAGATLVSHERPAGGGAACDAAFGPVPSIADAATDYTFPAGPLAFPNMW